MKILLVSYYFPPYNAIGSVRTGKLARFFREQGHDVRVLTARDVPLQPTLPVEIEAERISATRWFNVNFLPELLMGGRQQVAAGGYATSSSMLARLGFLYKTVFNYPDHEAGWQPFARIAGGRLLRNWRPDVIYASAQPFTALIIAAQLSRAYGIPWVGELRDLWTQNQDYAYPGWRRVFEEWHERRTLRSASGLVTVSAPLAEKLRTRYACPVEVVANGFDPADYPPDDSLHPADRDHVRIVYTGNVYASYADGQPLLQALAAMGEERERLELVFFGRNSGGMQAAAEKYGVGRLIKINGQIAYRESLHAQREADVLLMLLWNDPQERGVLTGKLFEYIGARRPILAVGLGHDLAAELIRERGLGVVSNDPEQIAAQLREWLALKQQTGRLADLPAEAGRGLSRREQYEHLETFLSHLIMKTTENRKA